LNARLLQRAWLMRNRTEAQSEADNFRIEKAFFGLTIWYLFLHFAALLVEAAPFLSESGW
jgi:protoheme IX farnesyltransferase